MKLLKIQARRSFGEAQVVVDHLILTGKELEGIKVSVFAKLQGFFDSVSIACGLLFRGGGFAKSCMEDDGNDSHKIGSVGELVKGVDGDGKMSLDEGDSR
jgi:hypothetical protein